MCTLLLNICWGLSTSCFVHSFMFQVISEKILCTSYLASTSITSHNKRLLQKLLNTQQESYLHWRETAPYLHSHLTKLLLTSHNMSYPMKSLIYLKQACTSLSTKIKIEQPKSLLPSKRLIICLSTTPNPRKLKPK